MRSFPNIERSAFHRGQYVGYSCSMPWRIVPSNSSYGRWLVSPRDHGGGHRLFFAWRLADVSARLDALNETYTRGLRALTWFASTQEPRQ